MTVIVLEMMTVTALELFLELIQLSEWTEFCTGKPRPELQRTTEYRALGFQIVYLDETWVNKNHSADYMWLPTDRQRAPVVPSGKGNRMIALRAGSRDTGLIDGCELVFEAKKSSGDYHQEMNGDVFMNWMEHQLLPNLYQPTLIVMDNASNHNVREPCSITPTMSSLKKTMQDFLTLCGVHYRPADTKIQLMEKIRMNRKPIQYRADVLAA
ncbi:uncharacterized protein LOC124265087 [Haliotis rubra]|uniref:uncharacterized protein LOC124265087 n=1 Tax=Haliotis rubra TaxID=36100 RepID=UPI001EE4F97B|nr:uncharacterized protein LOC124265087 [Haliotis rubra]